MRLQPNTNKMATDLVIIIIIIGLVAGMLSGLIGIGGGIILVPALIYFLSYGQHQAQGTSLGVLTFPVVLVAFLNYYNESKRTGHPIDWKVIGLLAVGFVVGGYFGSKLAIRIDQSMLKKIFAIILFYTAFKMLNWDKVIFGWFR